MPRELWGKADPELLAILMGSPDPVVTLDRALPTEHTAQIPANNPGIVVVGFSRDVPRTITTGEAGKILRRFKARIPSWHQLSLRSSIIEITEKSIEVWHIAANKLIEDAFIEFDEDEKWLAKFVALLTQNAQRHADAPLTPSALDAGRTDAPS